MADGSANLSGRISAESPANPGIIESHNVEKEEDKIACFCGDSTEFGEMACCELCSGWFHFRCMGYKEDVGLLDNRDFVCCFCVASKTLSLVKEVEFLRSEVKELRQKLASHFTEEVPRKSDQLEATVEREAKDQAREETSYSAVVKRKESTKQPSGKETLESISRGRKTTQKRTKERVQTDKKKAPPTQRKQPQPEKKFVERRKLWGTKRVTTEEEVKAFLVSRVPEAESVEVKRVFKSEEGRYRWWFWLMGDESVLKVVDQGSFGDFWKIESYSPFLESATVRVLSR